MRRGVAILAVTWLAACAPRPSLPDEPCELGQVVGGQAEPEAAEKVPLPRKHAWEAAHGGEVAARPSVAARLAGWPRVRVARDLPADDRAFLQRLARTRGAPRGVTDRDTRARRPRALVAGVARAGRCAVGDPHERHVRRALPRRDAAAHGSG
jgi:hypothetical protein